MACNTSATKFVALLVLWLLFTTVIALRDTTNYEHNKQDAETTTIPNGLSTVGTTTSTKVDLQEAVIDGVPTTFTLSNKGLQGRKMLVNDVVIMRNYVENMMLMKEERGVLMKDGYSSMKSDAGKVENDASMKSSVNGASSSHNNMINHDQNDNNKLMKAKKMNSASKKNVHSPAGSEPVDDGFINNFMHKDYNGNNGLKPRRKPPINNYHPMDEYHTPLPHPPVPTTYAQMNDNASPRHRPPSNSASTYEPLTVDYSTTPRPNPPNLNYEPLNTDYVPKGLKQRKPPINNHESLDDEDDVQP